MQMKKLLSTGLALALLTTSAIGVMAEDTPAAEATNPIIGNAIVGAATQDVTANFTYVAEENASATVTVDVDENAKTEVLNKNFDDLTAGSTYASVNVGPSESSPNGVEGVTADVVASPTETGRGSNVLSIHPYYDQRFNIYDGTSYDATFWMYAKNTQWDGINIQVKPDVYLAYRGTLLHSGVGGDADGLGLYIGYSACGNSPAAEVEKGSADCLAYVNLNEDYGYKWSDAAGHYWRIVTTYNNVKVYINTVNDFTNVKPIIDVTLGGDKVGNRSILQFSQANTGLWIDDVVISEIGTAPKNDGDEGKGLLVKDIDFEGTALTSPQHTTYTVSGTDGYLTMDKTGDTPKDAILLDNINGDYTATFWFKGANASDDRFRVRIRDNYYLHIRGTGSHGGTIKNDADANAYGIGLMNGSGIWGATFLESAALPTNANNGYWAKIQLIDNVVKVWMVQTAAFTGEFTGEPLISYAIEGALSNCSPFAFANRNSTGVLFDDLKIVSANKGSEGKLIYANDYDTYICDTTGAQLVTNETKGNTIYGRATTATGTGNTNDWSDRTLFSTPENFEMTYWINPKTQDYCYSQVFLKNEINIRIYGKGHHTYDSLEENPIDKPVIALSDGSIDLDYISTYTIPGMGAEPFANGAYFKARFVDNNVKVYMAKTEDFVDAVLLFDYTFENLSTTKNLVRIYAKNENTHFDNFKVYDLDKTVAEDIGAGYKQVVLNGTDVKLVDVVDGVVTELGSYTLPFAGARYRISVAKANGKLNVYVNGKSQIEVDSNAAGLMFYEGADEARTVLGTAAPIVISAGDLNYSEGVDTADLILMRKVLLGLDKTAYFTEAVNVDADSEIAIDIRDLIRMKKIIANVA